MVRIPARESDVFLQRNFQIGSGFHPGFYSMGVWGYPAAVKRQESQANHLQTVPSLRVREALPPVPYTPLWHAQGHRYVYLFALN